MSGRRLLRGPRSPPPRGVVTPRRDRLLFAGPKVCHPPGGSAHWYGKTVVPVVCGRYVSRDPARVPIADARRLRSAVHTFGNLAYVLRASENWSCVGEAAA